MIAAIFCFSNLQHHSVSNGIDKFVGSGRRVVVFKNKKNGRRRFQEL